MDLNVSPFPEEKHAESAAATLPREPKERIRKLQCEHEDQGAKRLNRGHMRINREAPQGWMDCPAFGQCIGKIIPSKVPLDESYNESVPPGKRYSSNKLIYETRKAGHDIGLVLDLTNTTRYYSPREWTKLGIKHHKIACRGRDAVPDNESVSQFVYAVMEFLQSPENGKYILVHCTHGHNRTGFMIVHYLMRTTLTSVSQALQKFAESRPPGIYKRDYIQALYKFYHEVPQNLYKICPSIPEWKRSEDLDLNGERDEDDGGFSAISHDNTENNTITNDDVLGDAIPRHQQESLRHLCYRLLEMDVRANGQFPGSHPVSLNKENMQLLKQRYYEATWKADGTRYMMLIMRHGCYLIDRTFTFRRIQMRFPLRKKIPNGLHDMTLIDGEMVIDKIKKDGEMIIDKVEKITYKRRYLAYDLMAINGHSIIKLPFCQRMKLLEEEIIKPRNYEKEPRNYENNPAYKYDMEPFSVRRKEFWPLSTVYKNFIPKLSHDADGLIFQGRDDTYVCRTHEGLLKWKPPKLNSVDFLFELGSENRPLLFLHQKGMKRPMHGERIKFSADFSGKEDILSGKIIECSKDPKENCWKFSRVRHDKSTPNDINTYRKVMRSIEDNITQDVLVGEIKEIVRLPMYQS